MAAAHIQDAPLFPELVPPPDLLPRFAVWGLLDEDARVFVSAGSVKVQVVVRQHLQSFPEASHVLAVYTMPSRGSLAATDTAAHDLARSLRTCAEVVITGSGLVPGVHRGRCVSVLLECRGLALAPDIGAPPFATAPSIY